MLILAGAQIIVSTAGRTLRRHLFFDLDGTLTDPRDGIVRSIQHALTDLSIPVPGEDELERLIGLPLQESLRTILASHGEHLVPQALQLYRERYKTEGMFENSVYPDVRKALDALAAAGWTLWVVTSKPSVFAREIVSHFSLARHFRGVHGSELSGERSDKSELIAHVLRAERISPPSVIMIGDRSYDIVGARRNGLRCAGVLWGYGSRHELADAGADALYGTVAELVSDLTSECPLGMSPSAGS